MIKLRSMDHLIQLIYIMPKNLIIPYVSYYIQIQIVKDVHNGSILKLNLKEYSYLKFLTTEDLIH